MSIRLFFCALLFCGQAYAETSVWEVSNGNQRLFIGGTIHILGKNDYPLPNAYEQAYQQSDHLVFETDIGQVNTSEFTTRLQQLLTYSDGNSLKNTLQPGTYRQLEQYCEQAGIPIMLLHPLKPPLVSMMLTVLELKKIGIDHMGVDHYFNMKAKQDGKAITRLESIEQQLQFLSNMAIGHEDELILSTIEENRQLSSLMQSMMRAWREGNQAMLEDTFIKPMKKDFPSVYNQLLVQRNNNWHPEIERLLGTPEIEFVLVGTLHLVGDDGLIRLLQNRGYQVKQW